jgi:hypothetical protein
MASHWRMNVNATKFNNFDLRSLEGALVCLCRTLTGGRFVGTSPAWPSLGQEAHRLDTIARTPDDDDSLWRLERYLRKPLLALQHPNDFPLEARVLHLGG